MLVIPAVDILRAKCVRLKKGDYNQETVYGDDPLEMALYWQKKGAKKLHIVDLDGAREGKAVQMDLIINIIKNIEIPVQIGGGIRDMKTLAHYLEAGADRVIIGTAVIESPEILGDLMDNFDKNNIVVSIDAREGKVAIEGWEKTSEIDVLNLARDLQNKGIKNIVYTDISRDGMMSGPDISGISLLKKSTNLNIIASGGISSKANLAELDKIGIKEAIVGKALYQGDIKIGGDN